MSRHTFVYVTDSLTAYVSWRQAWSIWLEANEKDEDDYSITGMEAETHYGKTYLGECDVWLEEHEINSFMDD